MPKRVLDVGQCAVDHAAIRSLVEKNFDAVVERAHQLSDTLEAARGSQLDLVLVNRKLDADHSDGLEIIKAIKSDPELARLPCMLVTNYEEHQQSAIAAGAEPGFGKAKLDSTATLERLAKFLAERQ